MVKKAFIVFFLIIGMGAVNPCTHAYVLQGPHILELMIEKLGRAQRLFVSQKYIFYRMGKTEGQQTVRSQPKTLQPIESDEPVTAENATRTDENARSPETFELKGSCRYIFSRAYRSDVRSLNSERIHIYADGRELTIVDGGILSEAENRFEIYNDLLLFRSRQDLVDRLSGLGVDVSVSSLGRLEGQIAFVVGDQYPNESVSQIWFHKDTFLPLRWIVKSDSWQAASDQLDIRFLEWWKVGNTMYPSRIEFYQDQTLVRVIQAKNIEVDPTFSEKLFDIRYLKASYPQVVSGASGYDQFGEPNEVQQTIEEFRRIYE